MTTPFNKLSDIDLKDYIGVYKYNSLKELRQIIDRLREPESPKDKGVHGRGRVGC